ncbi:MAG: DUF624 domain-containing protein [Oscillospiraceae bacterium]|nr:DUF624 domain-containing protein [Oscillospiraceae bacterium]
MKIFSAENPVFRFISRIGDMFMLSFFWLITSLPVITLGASTTAAYDCAFKILRARDTNVFKDFFKSFKNNFKQATALWGIMLPIGAVIALDLYYWAQKSESQMAFFMNAISLGIALLYVSTLLYLFPVQAIFENPVKKTLSTAFFMALQNWPNTLLLVVVSVGISYVLYILPIVLYLFLLIGSGVFTMIYAVRFLVIFRKYNEALMPDRPEAVDGQELKPEKKPRKKKVIR